MQNENELLSRAADGDRAACDALLAHYRDAVYRQVLRRVGNTQDAEEVTQNVFIKVYLNLRSFRGDGGFEAWVRSIAHREGVSWVRDRRPVTIELSPYAESLPNEEATPEQAVLKDETRRAVRRALESLPEHERRVAQAFYLEGSSYREIQTRYGLAKSSVADYLYRARRHLAQRLEGMLSLVWLPGWRSLTLLESGVSSGSASAPLAKAAVVTVTVAAATALTTTVLPPSPRPELRKPAGGVSVRERRSERNAKGEDFLTRALRPIGVAATLTIRIRGAISRLPAGAEGPRSTGEGERVKAEMAGEQVKKAWKQVGEEEAQDEAREEGRKQARRQADAEKEAQKQSQVRDERNEEESRKRDELAEEESRKRDERNEKEARERDEINERASRERDEINGRKAEEAAEAKRGNRATTGSGSPT
jgi:RNA polymerase sigma-70 factor (ECF subfamily)